jgi:peptidoglycan-N-acetylglucosamine deacetylase
MAYIHKKFRQLGNAYALWRIKPTPQELHGYNQTDRVLLTFDDYADEPTTRRFLDILEKKHIKAAFFLIGEWAEKNPDVVAMIKSAGHWVGNHTYSHRKLTKLSSNEIEKEITKGVTSTLLRPPYGAYDARIREIANKLGYHIVFWTASGEDWKQISTLEIQQRVLDDLTPGGCVLLHLNGINTLEALPGLIEKIRARGFELCDEGNEILLG